MKTYEKNIYFVRMFECTGPPNPQDKVSAIVEISLPRCQQDYVAPKKDDDFNYLFP